MKGRKLCILGPRYDGPTAGHLEFTRTFHKMSNSIFWPGKQPPETKYLKDLSIAKNKNAGLFNRRGIAGRYLHLLHFLAGLTHTCLATNVGFLITVCIGHYNRHHETRATLCSMALATAFLVIQQPTILRTDVPRKILSDKGGAFLSIVVHDLILFCQTTH